MVDVVGRAKVIVETVIDKSSLDTSSGKIGAGLKRGALLGVAALGTLAVAGVKAVQAFEDGEASARKLENVLGNMGKAGAAESVEKLADTLQRQTGVSDDTIRSGETLLATFSEVAKSAGETGGAFERATKAAVDMSAAGFGSVESASIQLGKALQDPIKGVQALNRSGITFTADQKKMIEALVETGKAGEAQKIILDEVEKQVKGTGKATATESKKIKAAMGEVQEGAGEAIAALLGDGKKGGSLSDLLFDVADSLHHVAGSKDWETLGQELRGIGKAAKYAGGKFLDFLKTLQKGVPSQYLFNTFKNEDNGRDINVGDLLGGSGTDNDNNPFNASGVRNWRGGLSAINERGYEIIDLPKGSNVYTHEESRAMAATSGMQLTQIFNGPNTLAQARREADLAAKYGTRYGGATWAGAM